MAEQEGCRRKGSFASPPSFPYCHSHSPSLVHRKQPEPSASLPVSKRRLAVLEVEVADVATRAVEAILAGEVDEGEDAEVSSLVQRTNKELMDLLLSLRQKENRRRSGLREKTGRRSRRARGRRRLRERTARIATAGAARSATRTRSRRRRRRRTMDRRRKRVRRSRCLRERAKERRRRRRVQRPSCRSVSRSFAVIGEKANVSSAMNTVLTFTMFVAFSLPLLHLYFLADLLRSLCSSPPTLSRLPPPSASVPLLPPLRTTLSPVPPLSLPTPSPSSQSATTATSSAMYCRLSSSSARMIG